MAGNHWREVDQLIVAVMIHIKRAIELNIDFFFFCVFGRIGALYSAAEYTGLTAEGLSELKSAPRSVPVSFCTILLREPISPVKLVKCTYT